MGRAQVQASGPRDGGAAAGGDAATLGLLLGALLLGLVMGYLALRPTGARSTDRPTGIERALAPAPLPPVRPTGSPAPGSR